MDNTVLVTGGAGFLGVNLIKRLLDNNEHVICLDNYQSSSVDNIQSIENKNLEIIRHDIRVPISLQVDQIYNLACPASPIHYQANPIYTTETIVQGASNMLDLAYKNNAKIMQASTSEVYGNPINHPQVESDWGNVNPIGIRSCYDEGKRVAESLCMDYHRMKGVDVRIARIFNTYGEYMHPGDGRVVSNFIMQALNNEDITIYGDGTQTRSFCHVSDTVDGFIRLMAVNEFSSPINIGNPYEFTVSELAILIIKLIGSKSKVVYHDLPSDDPVRRNPNIHLASAVLNWKPKVTLVDGLIKTINYFKGLYE